jgi:hypothetical protein
LGRAGPFGDERLVVLFEEALVSVGGFTGEARQAASSTRRRTTPASSATTSADRRGAYPGVPRGAALFLRLELGADDEDEVEVESERVVAVDAVIEPTQGFVYFVGAGTTFWSRCST